MVETLGVLRKSASTDVWTAMCNECHVHAATVPRVGDCARGMPKPADFVCVDCDTIPGTMKCPNEACGILVSKTDGCNHMTCRCFTHFCYLCGYKGEDGEAVYDHLNEVHGRIY